VLRPASSVTWVPRYASAWPARSSAARGPGAIAPGGALAHTPLYAPAAAAAAVPGLLAAAWPPLTPEAASDALRCSTSTSACTVASEASRS